MTAWHRTQGTVTHYQQGTGYSDTVATRHSALQWHTGLATETAAVIKVQFRMLLQSTIGDLDIITGNNICVPCEAIQMIVPKWPLLVQLCKPKTKQTCESGPHTVGPKACSKFYEGAG